MHVARIAFVPNRTYAHLCLAQIFFFETGGVQHGLRSPLYLGLCQNTVTLWCFFGRRTVVRRRQQGWDEREGRTDGVASCEARRTKGRRPRQRPVQGRAVRSPLLRCYNPPNNLPTVLVEHRAFTGSVGGRHLDRGARSTSTSTRRPPDKRLILRRRPP